MLKGFIAFFVVFSLSYWIGYIVHKIAADKRPVCFLSYGDSDRVECYFGSFEQPYSNDENIILRIPMEYRTTMYFYLSKDTLLKKADGQHITMVVNVAYHSLRKSHSYLLKKKEQGTVIKLLPE